MWRQLSTRLRVSLLLGSRRSTRRAPEPWNSDCESVKLDFASGLEVRRHFDALREVGYTIMWGNSMGRGRGACVLCLFAISSAAYGSPDENAGGQRQDVVATGKGPGLSAEQKKEMYDAARRKENQRVEAEARAISEKNERLATQEARLRADALQVELARLKPIETDCKKRWLDWVRTQEQPLLPPLSVHSVFYLDGVKDPQESKLVSEGFEKGEDLFRGLTLYSRDLAQSNDKDFDSDFDNLLTFRREMLKGNGLGNLVLADYAGQLAYAVLQIRAFNCSGAQLSAIQTKIDLIPSVWDEGFLVEQTIAKELSIKLTIKNKILKRPKGLPWRTPDVEFTNWDPIGVRSDWVEHEMNLQSVSNRVEQKARNMNPAMGFGLQEAVFTYLVSKLGRNVYYDVVLRKSDLKRLCEFLKANHALCAMPIERKLSISDDEIVSMKLAIPTTNGKDARPVGSAVDEKTSLLRAWEESKCYYRGFQMGEPLNYGVMYLQTEGIFLPGL